MKILFKNGAEIEISTDIAKILHQRISTGCATHQFFSDENGNLKIMINVSEIVLMTEIVAS
jgi:hypothetical protein